MLLRSSLWSTIAFVAAACGSLLRSAGGGVSEEAALQHGDAHAAGPVGVCKSLEGALWQRHTGGPTHQARAEGVGPLLRQPAALLGPGFTDPLHNFQRGPGGKRSPPLFLATRISGVGYAGFVWTLSCMSFKI